MRKILGITALMAVAASPVAAQKGPEGRIERPEQAKRIDGHKGGWERKDADRGPRGRGSMFSPDRMFAMIDANRDNVISRKEFDGFHARMRDMRRDHRGAHGFAKAPRDRKGPQDR